MAFATSNIVRENAGSQAIMRGSWTGSVGDDEGTVTGSGYALGAEFYDHRSETPGQRIIPRISNSSGTWTVTVPYSQAVTAGTFKIEFK